MSTPGVVGDFYPAARLLQLRAAGPVRGKLSSTEPTRSE